LFAVGWISRQRKDVAALVGVFALLALLSAAPAGAAKVPNDPYFPLQWGDENSGQAILEQGHGVPFADDSAAEAWGVSTGSRSIVIAETDTGVNYELPDLAANIWTNTEGLLGCPPLTTHGFDVLNASFPAHCMPQDTDNYYGGHGTHVAGIIGALGNNSLGVTGLNWETTILPIRWLEDANEQAPKQELLAKALELIVELSEAGVPVRVVNDSATFRGNSMYNGVLHDAIERLAERGILFVTSAGNGGTNDDSPPQALYPCDYHLPNEICVTASNNRDELPSFANWGPNNVDLAAPGAGVYSTLRNGEFERRSGASMAAAQVSGAAGLILSAEPRLTVGELKSDILSHVDRRPAFEGRVATGGRLDVCRAMPGCTDVDQLPAPPPPQQHKTPPAPPVPLLSALKLRPSSFRAARRGASISSARAKPGTLVTYNDTQASMTEFSVLEPRPGVLNRTKRCVAPPHHRSTHGHRAKSCLRYVRVGRFWRVDSPGANMFHFSGRVGGGRLAPGRYRLQAIPALAGASGVGAGVNFRIIS
jgi:subtilisin family serine protease